MTKNGHQQQIVQLSDGWKGQETKQLGLPLHNTETLYQPGLPLHDILGTLYQSDKKIHIFALYFLCSDKKQNVISLFPAPATIFLCLLSPTWTLTLWSHNPKQMFLSSLSKQMKNWGGLCFVLKARSQHCSLGCP